MIKSNFSPVLWSVCVANSHTHRQVIIIKKRKATDISSCFLMMPMGVAMSLQSCPTLCHAMDCNFIMITTCKDNIQQGKYLDAVYGFLHRIVKSIRAGKFCILGFS